MKVFRKKFTHSPYNIQMSLTRQSPKAKQFNQEGYYVEPSLFREEECDHLIEHYMSLRVGPLPGDCEGFDATSTDPLKRYPRMVHMHRWDDISLQWGIDQRIHEVLIELLEEEPYLVQTMMYFKPAGGRGQALHQDNTYLRAEPGTCVAAWLALDDCDEENGCLQIVPHTQQLPVMCTIEADTTKSFTGDTTPLPEGLQPQPIIMNRGDCLFFNGSVIHGSFPNTSTNRFRRSLIGHYITGNCKKVAQFYHPVLRMDGSNIEFEQSEIGSECGVWIEDQSEPKVKMIASASHDRVAKHE